MPRGGGLPADEAIPLVAEACAYYDVHDVTRWFERNKRMVGHYPFIYPSTLEDIRTFRKVPNEALRKAWAESRAPMILGVTLKQGGAHEGSNHLAEPEWCSLFREEIERIRALPEAFDSRPRQIGPRELTHQRISQYLRVALGIDPNQREGSITLQWLLYYEVAEALCKALGLVPITVGI